MKKLKFNFISWKFLLPVGVVLMLVVNFKWPVGVLGIVLAALGAVDLVRAWLKKSKKRKEDAGTNAGDTSSHQ